MKKNLVCIMLANILNMVLVAATNFILPKFTSIDTYAAIKEYTLYITTYSSIATIGYAQGAYLKYGGKEIKKMDPKEVGRNVFSFFVFMLPICIVITIIGMMNDNIIIIALGTGIMVTNLQGYYQLFYQATGNFKEYGYALNSSRIGILLIYIILIFVIRTDNRGLFVCATPCLGIVIAIYLTIKLNKTIPIIRNLSFDFREIKLNVKNGFVLMLGDFVTKFFSSIDRWFVKTLMDTFHFAMYSFAVSMENLVNTFMAPFTVSMFNYFCKKPSIEEIKRTKEITLIYSFIIIAAAYPAKWILENFMSGYMSANAIIFPLFAAQGFGAIIKGIYVNKYKAEGEQKKYLFQMIAMLILAIVLNAIFYYITRSMVSLAIATLITNVVWFVICEKDSPQIRYNAKVIISIIIMLSIYIVTGYTLNSIIGCMIYCISGFFTAIIFMRKSFIYTYKSMVDMIKLKLKIKQ